MQERKKTKVKIRDLHCSFGSRKVINGLNLDVETSTSLAIIGRSGVGKSVLVRCILGLIKPDRGQVLVDGHDIHRAPSYIIDRLRREVGILFQGLALFDSMTVRENIVFGLGIKDKEVAYETAIKFLHLVGLSASVLELIPSELSGGMKKRVALARTIAKQPSVIIFDEPTTGLDPISSSVITSLIPRTINYLKATAITVTHDLPSIAKIARQVAMLHEGKIVWHGMTEALATCNNPYIAQFRTGKLKGPMTKNILPDNNVPALEENK